MSSNDIEEKIMESEESEKYAVLRTLYEKENIEFKSDLSDRQIKAIVIVEEIDKILKTYYKIDVKLKDITHAVKTHNVSRKRLGRAEAVDVLKGEDKEKKGLLQRLAGM